MAVTTALACLGLATVALAGPTPLDRRAVPVIQTITAAQWNSLNSSVGGRLYKGYPLARPCYALATSGTNGAFNAGQCAAVQNGYTNDIFIADHFGGYMNTNWATCQTKDDCTLDYQAPQNPLAYAARTCAQGSVPYYYVDVRQPSDVSAVLAFAKSTKVPIVVKNSGHDYKGRSSAPDSLGIWMHNVQSLKLNKAFVAAGCASSTAQTAITHGGGNGFKSLYEFAEANDVTIVGGSSETVVAAGGWISGAGHSALSNTLGLGVDRTLEMKIVMPDGKYVTASRCQNQDLFFAARGGGGGVFGVVMEQTMIASPRLTLQVAYIRFVSPSPQAASRFMEIIIENSLKWADEGWGGYIEPAAMAVGNGFVLMTPKLTNAEAKASMKPITDFVGSLALGNVALDNMVTEYSSFLKAYNAALKPNEELVGLKDAIASRFVPKANFATNSSRAELLTALNKGIATAGTNVLPLKSVGLVYGGAPTQILVTAPTNFAGDGTGSETPAWRSTVWHVLYAPTFSYASTPSQIAAYWKQATTAADFMRKITPNAAYQNEAFYNEPNPEETFWGQSNYNKLLAYKKKIDVNNLLTCRQCIGWDSSDPRYACYPSV